MMCFTKTESLVHEPWIVGKTNNLCRSSKVSMEFIYLLYKRGGHRAGRVALCVPGERRKVSRSMFSILLKVYNPLEHPHSTTNTGDPLRT